MNNESETLYSTGDRVMRKHIGIYLDTTVIYVL